ncbi:disulfide oxidoreductase [Lentibacillus sp. N15]|uniref:disulfide oxidoreductase n=1 Tax=Lentibacillus songyuanensis TaxID=3136161 RepID=UPI0031BB7461
MKNAKYNETILLIVWGQAFIALAGSLFYSEVMGYTPCELCWFERILMYPLVVIYGAAAIKRNLSIAIPGLIMSGIGILVAMYHYLIQKLPALHEVGGSCGIIPCNTEYINYLGFITIPFLAFIAFIVIFVCHLILLKQQKGES